MPIYQLDDMLGVLTQHKVKLTNKIYGNNAYSIRAAGKRYA